ncbi:hypothetical protein NCCP2222_00890 [Sporosarcina sp. NCCP-2222]|uniref:hypothetical protein n=1 Tax=Sporosarcina sp. NCCP-2222 TaxID=2935073 RepID=UPI00208685BE|nr:hypothetical protein [Sporosarcina sp. NCCP-2222]GKV54142.1 hypothetical protein NCCP2222_00890 [Sporosarcina sp. NCCP-2222]
MIKKLSTMVLVAILGTSLAACGDEKQEDAAKGKDNATSVQSDSDKAEKDDQSKTTASELKEDQLGMNAEQFQEAFNKAAEKVGIQYRVDHSEWSEPRRGFQIVDIKFDEDYQIQLLGNEGEKDVRALMFGADEMDETATQIIMTLIRTVDTQVTEEEMDDILGELKLADSQEKQEYAITASHGYRFMLRNASMIEFIIANEDDPYITEENWKAGEF